MSVVNDLLVRQSVSGASRFVRGAVAALLAAGLMTVPVSAATIQVAAGAVSGSTSGCSLIDAINAANDNTATGACPAGDDADNGGDIIQLAAGAYTLTQADNYWYGPNGLPPIASKITIIGDPTGSTIERDSTAGTPAFRLFYVGGGQSLTGYNPPVGLTNLPGPSDLTLKNLTLKNGLAQGGDSGHGGGGLGAGGAVYNQGQLRLNGVTLNGNQAIGGGHSGASWGGGGMGGGAPGGYVGSGFQVPDGLWSPGAGITSSLGQFGNGGEAGDHGHSGYPDGAPGANGSVGGGGGTGGDGYSGSTGDPSGNGADGGFGGFGGGGANGGTGGYGALGGGERDGGDGGDGGFGGGGGDGGNTPAPSGSLGSDGNGGFGGGRIGGGAGLGGAIFNEGGTVSVLNSTFAANAARGGGGDAEGGDGYGGALFNLNGSVTIRYSTLAGNIVVSGSGGGGTPGSAAGGAAYNLWVDHPGSPAADAGTVATLIVNSSILTGSIDGDGDAVSDCETGSYDATSDTFVGGNSAKVTFTSGYDVVQTPGSTCSFPDNDQTAVLTLTLADNGGPTQTMALTAGTAPVDHGDTGATLGSPPGIDQRTKARDSTPDVGAYELNGASPVSVTAPDDMVLTMRAAMPSQTFTVNDNGKFALTVTAISSNTTLLPASGINIGTGCGNDASHYTCTLDLTPAAYQTGSSTVTLTATDAYGNTAQDGFAFTVNPPPPKAVNLSFSVGAGETFTGTLPALSESGNSLTWSIVTPPTHGTATVTNTSNGAFTYTPTAGASTDSFAFRVNDGVANSNSATVAITVDAKPPARIITLDSGGGGGGAFGWVGLLLLGGLTLRRRRQ